MSHPVDPVFRNARREGLIIMSVWLASTIYCCVYAYFFGYLRDAQEVDPQNLNLILGMPSWVFWGIMVPWGCCSLFTFWFCGFYMADDDLGSDHVTELEAEIREGGLDD